MGALAGRFRCARARALTLIEMILAMGLVLLIAAVGVINFAGLERSRKLTEGVRRFETVLRMAKADAANLGRCIRLSVDEERAELLILWEADPLGQPGQFTPYDRCTWLHHSPTELVRLTSCRLTGDSAQKSLIMASPGTGSFDDQTLFEAVTFYPDGSSDSAVFELQSSNPDDSRRAVIELDGLNGTVTTQIISSREYEEYIATPSNFRPEDG